jgi:molybdate transport system ATP-binding protein
LRAPALEAALSLRLRRGGERFDIDAELSLEQGVLVLFGPSGAGKSLTIQALAGLVRPTAGSIRVGGEVLFDGDSGVEVPAHRRRIGYVPQHDSLFPFSDVAANVAFGLPRKERTRDNPRVKDLLEELGIHQLAAAHPGSLSGGERQRVALARALAVRPRLLLLDEPFAAIDQEGRIELRRILRQTLDNHDMPAVVVTHDPEEALTLGDHLVLFDRGRTVRSGEPASLLRRGQTVMLTGELDAEQGTTADGRSTVRLREVTLEAPEELLETGADGRVVLRLQTPRDDS